MCAHTEIHTHTLTHTHTITHTDIQTHTHTHTRTHTVRRFMDSQSDPRASNGLSTADWSVLKREFNRETEKVPPSKLEKTVGLEKIGEKNRRRKGRDGKSPS